MTTTSLLDEIRLHLDRAIRFGLDGSQAHKDTVQARNLLGDLLAMMDAPRKKKDTDNG